MNIMGNWKSKYVVSQRANEVLHVNRQGGKDLEALLGGERTNPHHKKDVGNNLFPRDEECKLEAAKAPHTQPEVWQKHNLVLCVESYTIEKIM